MDLVREGEEDAGQEEVADGQGRDAVVGAVEGGEDERGKGDGEDAVDGAQLLVDVTAEEQLLMECRRGEDGDELEPRKAAGTDVAHVARQEDEEIGEADQGRAEEHAGEEVGKWRDGEADPDGIAVQEPKCDPGRKRYGEECDKLRVHETSPEGSTPGEQKCGKIKRTEQSEGCNEAVRGSHTAADRRMRLSMKRTGTDVAVLLLRVALALIFIPHGWSKVMGTGGVAAFVQDLPSYGIPAFLGYIAAWSELAGSMLLLFGLLARVDAFLLACTMGVATFVVQLPDALRDRQPGANAYFAAMHGIELPFALLAAALAVVILGPGRFSLDAVLWRQLRRAESPPYVSTAPAPR